MCGYNYYIFISKSVGENIYMNYSTFFLITKQNNNIYFVLAKISNDYKNVYIRILFKLKRYILLQLDHNKISTNYIITMI